MMCKNINLEYNEEYGVFTGETDDAVGGNVPPLL
jgi:hypothetical protein